jgi:hypothetical protein
VILASCMRAAFVAGVLSVAADAAAQPCARAVPSCTEFVEFAGPSTRILIYRTHPLDQKSADIARALVVVHGAGRDADNYFRHVLAGAYLAGALDNTVVVSMRFASNDGLACRDTLDAGELNWQCGGPGRWTAGGIPVGTSSGLFATGVNVTSFDAADAVVRKLRKRDIFPNLRAIVVSGHSAGGQFVSRYQMANQVHDASGAPITYVVANPSSYAYPDNLRPTASAVSANAGAAPPGYVPPLPETPAEPRWLCRSRLRRSPAETTRVETRDVSARRARYPPAVRIRRLLRGDGAGADAPCAWTGVCAVCQRTLPRRAQGADCAVVRTQCQVHVHGG